MKIPKSIENKMRRLVKLEQQASILSNEIDSWFIKQGYDLNMLRCGNGMSLEELNYGNDIVDEFIKQAELDFPGDAWDKVWK